MKLCQNGATGTAVGPLPLSCSVVLKGATLAGFSVNFLSEFPVEVKITARTACFLAYCDDGEQEQA